MKRYRLFDTTEKPTVGGDERPLVCSIDPQRLSEPGMVTVTATIDGTAPQDSGRWTVPIGLFVNGAQVDSENIDFNASGSENAEFEVQLTERGSYNIQITSGEPYQ